MSDNTQVSATRIHPAIVLGLFLAAAILTLSSTRFDFSNFGVDARARAAAANNRDLGLSDAEVRRLARQYGCSEGDVRAMQRTVNNMNR